MIRNQQSPPEMSVAGLLGRFAIMLAVLAGLILGSSRTRRLPPGKRSTVLINLLFFVVLGAVNEAVMGDILAPQPLARTASLVSETLLLCWFFSPGATKPASRTLFYVHIGPFFTAVFSGAIAMQVVRRWRTR